MMVGEKMFRLGGLHPSSHGTTVPDTTLWNAGLPSRIILPLHIDGLEPAASLVKPGDQVREGMEIGSAGSGGIPVHASLPGIVKDITTLQLPGVGECSGVVIDFKGAFDQLGKAPKIQEWHNTQPAKLISKLHSMGVVEPAFEEHNLVERLKKVAKKQLGNPRILVSLVDSDPLCMTEAVVSIRYAREIAQALEVLREILPGATIVFAYTRRSKDGAFATKKALQTLGFKVRLQKVSSAYPQYDYHHLVESVYSRELSLGMTAEDGGIFIVSPSALYSIYTAIVLGQPMIERIVTLAGGAVTSPRVMKARLGTPLVELIRESGKLKKMPEKIILGNSYRGKSVVSLTTPLSKEYTLVLALTSEEVNKAPTEECIQCGQCAAHCPMGLEPIRLQKMISKKLYKHAKNEGLDLCTSCGICSAVCPSRIPLTQELAKGKELLDG